MARAEEQPDKFNRVPKAEIDVGAKKPMTRPLGIDYPGALYHVMNRGNAGQDLFRTKETGDSLPVFCHLAGEP